MKTKTSLKSRIFALVVCVVILCSLFVVSISASDTLGMGYVNWFYPIININDEFHYSTDAGGFYEFRDSNGFNLSLGRTNEDGLGVYEGLYCSVIEVSGVNSHWADFSHSIEFTSDTDDERCKYNYTFTNRLTDYYLGNDFALLGFNTYVEIYYNNFLFNVNDDTFKINSSDLSGGHLIFYDYSISNEPIYIEKKEYSSFNLGNTIKEYYVENNYALPTEDIYIVDFYIGLSKQSLDAFNWDGSISSIEIYISDSLIDRNVSIDYYYVGENDYSFPFFDEFYSFVEGSVMKSYYNDFDAFTTDYVGWLVTAVGSFFSLEFAPFITIGSILSIIIMIALVVTFLKVFMGG